MPIEFKFDVQTMNKDRFHSIDYRVMRHVFDIQNEMGRLYNESIYQTELASRCADEGFKVISEGEIVVSHDAFSKSYFIDALIDSGAIYELKAVEAVVGHHESQLLNYLFLLGLSEGKLVNFASPSVQHQYVSTTVEASDRFLFEIEDKDWEKTCASGELVRDIVHNLLMDWGAYLDIELYKEALIHFLGGKEKLLQPIDISKDTRFIGCQKFHLLDQGTLLHVSSTIRNVRMYRKQLEKLFDHTNLEGIHWVNFCHQKIILTKLKK